ncbi:MAG: hypothetical protein WAW41_04670 [Methylobacter sp.]
MINFEEQDNQHLDALLKMETPEEFGASFIQRNIKVGYNRAFGILTLGVERGDLEPTDIPYRYRLSSADHPIVQQFWEAYDHLAKTLEAEGSESKDPMNHSRKPEIEIAVNLGHFHDLCAQYNLCRIDIRDLRRHLPTCQKREYLGNKSIRSRIEKRSVSCYIFKR